MVNTGIMSIETAQVKLGLDKEKNRPATADWNYGPPSVSSAAAEGAVCDDCEFFDEETNYCGVTGRETRFDALACDSFAGKHNRE